MRTAKWPSGVRSVRTFLAFELYPEVECAEVGCHEMPEVLGVVASLAGKDALGDSGGAVRNAGPPGPPVEEFLMNLLDDVGERVGISDRRVWNDIAL